MTRREELELRALTDRAFAVRDDPERFRAAVAAIEEWERARHWVGALLRILVARRLADAVDELLEEGAR